MHKRWRQLLTALFCLGGCTTAPKTPVNPSGIERWAVYYNDALPAEAFASYDLLVFDLRKHPPLNQLIGRPTTLAYISIGEINDAMAEKKKVDKYKLFLKRNERWNSDIVDLTAPKWQKLVLTWVDEAMMQGFDGVMLDTVESPLAWAKENTPQRYPLMRKAALKIIQDIRKKHPTIRIMLNRGFEILDEAAPNIDYILAESTFTHRDDFNGQFISLPPDTYADVVAQLHGLLARQRLTVLTLDYWNIDDAEGLRKIYAHQRRAGFVPYVTTQDLQHLTPEP